MTTASTLALAEKRALKMVKETGKRHVIVYSPTSQRFWIAPISVVDKKVKPLKVIG